MLTDVVYGRNCLGGASFLVFHFIETPAHGEVLTAVLRIRIRWIRKILVSGIRIRMNMRIHGFEKKIIKNFLILNGPSSLG